MLVGDTEMARFKVVVVVTNVSALYAPPCPWQVSVKSVAAFNGPTVSLPLVVFVPLQPLDAVQLSANCVAQVRVTLSPR